MNANAILEKILEDASASAAAILKDANDRAAQLRTVTDEKIARARKQTTDLAETDAAEAKGRMERMADLDERKLLLADKRVMIDRAFDLALAKMKAMPAKEARAYLLEQVAELADGTETIIPGGDNTSWLDGNFLADANAALVNAGRPGHLTLAQEKRPGVSGLILAKAQTEINCTYESLLNSQRLELEADAAQKLFPVT